MNVRKSVSPFTKRHRHSALKAGLIVLLSVSMLPTAHAIDCFGKVNSLAIDQYGKVMVSVGPAALSTICNITTQSSFAINTQACRIAYAGLLAAQTSGRNARIYYSAPTSCTQIGAWTDQPSAYFVENN